jgi:hypothetical protein
LHTFDDILRAYQRQVQLPWQSDLPPAGRVWIVWYDKSMQRRFKARLGEFEHATILAGHGWRQLDLAPSFGQWIAVHELFAPLLMQPKEVRGLLPEYDDHLAKEVEEELVRAQMCWRWMAAALCSAWRASQLYSVGGRSNSGPHADWVPRKAQWQRLPSLRCTRRMELPRRTDPTG